MIGKIHIETPRLIIRPPKLSDAKPLNDAINRSLDVLERWMPWASDPSLKATETFIQKSVDEWGSETQKIFPMIMVLKNTDEIIGASGYNESSDLSLPSFEIGYWIDSKYSGHGYVTECVTALTRYAFDRLNAVRVQIKTQKENEKSQAVAKRCGFKQEAVLEKTVRDCKTKLLTDQLIFTCFNTEKLPVMELNFIEASDEN